jgi:hypothetical protein
MILRNTSGNSILVQSANNDGRMMYRTQIKDVTTFNKGCKEKSFLNSFSSYVLCNYSCFFDINGTKKNNFKI